MLDQGLYEMTLDDYHKGQGAFAESKSTLSKMIGFDGSPWAYKWDKDNPEEDVREKFDEGTALHVYFTDRDNFEDHVTVKKKYTGKGSVAKNKEEEERIRESGKTPITEDFMEKLKEVDVALHSGRFETFVRVLENPENIFEQSGFWQDKKTGIWLKTRPDIIAPNKVLWDLKKHENSKSFRNVATDLHYDLQAYMALMGVTQITGVEHHHFGFLVFHTRKQPYEFEVLLADDDFLFSGKEKFEETIGMLAWGLKNDEWPGKVEDKVGVLSPSYWRLKELSDAGVINKIIE